MTERELNLTLAANGITPAAHIQGAYHVGNGVHCLPVGFSRRRHILTFLLRRKELAQRKPLVKS